jgi:hypothetical protein
MRLFSDLLNKNPLTRWLKNIRNRVSKALYLSRPARITQLPTDWMAEKNDAICYSIAFNHFICIDVLIEYWHKFARNTALVIVDNSSKKEAQQQICALCAEQGVPYLRLPANFEWNQNRSHALAMNWIYQNLVQKWRPRLFGFLDHDCFPYAPFDLSKSMGCCNIFGNKRISKIDPTYWNIWAGFCFFRLSRLENFKIDFTHSIELGLDTGGSNWNSIYQFIQPGELKNVLAGSVPKCELFSQMRYTIDNRFLHVSGASYRSKHINRNILVSALEYISQLNTSQNEDT